MSDTSRSRAQLSQESTRLYLSGRLDHASVADLYPTGRARIREAAGGGGPLILDLSRLDGSDSSALALLIDWLRTAHANSVQLRFCALPRQLREIARVCGLVEYLDSMTDAA